MRMEQLAPELRGKIRQKELAQVLDVVPRTLRNWRGKTTLDSFKKLGRPAHDERAHRKAFWRVGREFVTQGGCSWRNAAQALGKTVPTRLIQAHVRLFKACRKRHERRRILANRQRIEVLAKNALWVQDGAQMGRTVGRKKIESQIVKDRGPLITVGIATGAPASGADVVSLLERLKRERGLPLVLGTDNGSAYVCEETEKYLEREKVIHLRSLPRTPEHNGSAEVGVGEIKRCSGLGPALITTPEAAHTKAVGAAARLNQNRLRMSKGFKTAARLDEELIVGYHLVERSQFYEECSRRVEQAKLGKSGRREERMAERDAIFETMERYRLVKRHRGGTHAAAKAEIFS